MTSRHKDLCIGNPILAEILDDLFEKRIAVDPPALGEGHALKESFDHRGLHRLEVSHPLQTQGKAAVYVGFYTDIKGVPLTGEKVVFKVQDPYLTQLEYVACKLFVNHPTHVVKYKQEWKDNVVLVDEPGRVIKDDKGEVLTPNWNEGVWHVLVMDSYSPILDFTPPENEKDIKFLKIARDLLTALRDFERDGIVYRDLKIENMLWDHQMDKVILYNLATAAHYIDRIGAYGLYDGVTTISACSLRSYSLLLICSLEEVKKGMPHPCLKESICILMSQSVGGFKYKDDMLALGRALVSLVARWYHYDGCGLEMEFTGMADAENVALYDDIEAYKPSDHTVEENEQWSGSIHERIMKVASRFQQLSSHEDNCVRSIEQAFPQLDKKVIDVIRSVFLLAEDKPQTRNGVPVTLDSVLAGLDELITELSPGPQSLQSRPSLMPNSPAATVLDSPELGLVGSHGGGGAGVEDHDIMNQGSSEGGVEGSNQSSAHPGLGAGPVSQTASGGAGSSLGVVLGGSNLGGGNLAPSGNQGASPSGTASTPHALVTSGHKLSISSFHSPPNPLPEHVARCRLMVIQGILVVIIPRIEGKRTRGLGTEKAKTVYWACECGFVCPYQHEGKRHFVPHYTQKRLKENYCQVLVSRKSTRPPLFFFDPESKIVDLELQQIKTVDWNQITIAELEAWHTNFR